MAEITPQARAMAVDKLGEIEETMNQLACWLSDHGEDQAAAEAHECWRDVLAVRRLVERGPGRQQRAAADGHYQQG
jgi:hypothetical protein